jgi:acetoin utilization protein AcuB
LRKNSVILLTKNVFTMIARELISADILPLQTSTSGRDALYMMQDYHVRHLPIVNDKQILGLVSEEDILEQENDNEPIGSVRLSLNHPYVHDKDHIYEIMRLLNQFKLTLIPVIDKEENYLGVVTLHDLLKYFAKSASFSEPGSVVVLSVSKRNYSLSQIARIVESEQGIILNSFITSMPDSEELEITLKINRPDIGSILKTFVRFDYEIKASFTESEYIDSLQEHYDSLMSYLNV